MPQGKGTYGSKVGRPAKKYNKGGALKSVPSGNKGLGKLPTDVRNKMGYMKGGGKAYTPKYIIGGVLGKVAGSLLGGKKKGGAGKSGGGAAKKPSSRFGFKNGGKVTDKSKLKPAQTKNRLKPAQTKNRRPAKDIPSSKKDIQEKFSLTGKVGKAGKGRPKPLGDIVIKKPAKKFKDGGKTKKYFLGGALGMAAKAIKGRKGGGKSGGGKAAMAARGMKGKPGMMGKMMSKGKPMGGKGGMMKRPGMKGPGGMLGGKPGGMRPGGMRSGARPGGGMMGKMMGGMKRPGGPGMRPGGGGGIMGAMKKPGMAEEGTYVPKYFLGGLLKKVGGAAKKVAGMTPIGMAVNAATGKGALHAFKGNEAAAGAEGIQGEAIGPGGQAEAGGDVGPQLASMEARLAKLESGGPGMAKGPGMPGGLFGGIGSMFMSDERMKKNIKRVGKMSSKKKRFEKGGAVDQAGMSKMKSMATRKATMKSRAGSVGSKMKRKYEAGGVAEKLGGVKDKLKGSGLKDKLKSKAISKGAGKGVTKALKSSAGKRALGKGAAKLGARAIPGVGGALLAKDAYKFLDKKQVGQKSVKNIGKSSGRAFLGKMEKGGVASKLKDKDILNIKPKINLSASVDTNKGPNLPSRKSLAKKHKIHKKEKFDANVKKQKKMQGTIDVPRSQKQMQAMARANPVGSIMVGGAAIAKKLKGNKKMKKGGMVKGKKMKGYMPSLTIISVSKRKK